MKYTHAIPLNVFIHSSTQLANFFLIGIFPLTIGKYGLNLMKMNNFAIFLYCNYTFRQNNKYN